jgi:alanyl-tRNA synthetase
VVLAAIDGERVQLAAGVTSNLIAHVKAGELVAYVAGQVGGKGGGKPDFAMAGGQQPAAVNDALESVRPWVEGRLP